MKKILALMLTAMLAVMIGLPGIAQTEGFDQEVDLLVIGGGVAGLTGAVEAADLGVEKILLVEKLAYYGGSAFVSAGILAGYETSVTRKMDLHIDPVDLYNDQMKEKRNTLDPELTRISTEKSGETIDWLIDHLGVAFDPEVVHKEGYGSYQAVHLVTGGGPGMREGYQKALEQRPNIEVQLETRATELLTADGAVIGAVVQKGEETLRIKAKAVLLATGGYSGNRELMGRLHPANSVFMEGAMPGYTGDGLIMATAIGAGVNNVDQIQCYLREYEDGRSQMPYMFSIYVGNEGKRFMDEKRTPQTYNNENRLALIEQYAKDQQDYFWCINDDAAMKQFQLDEAARTHPGMFIADSLEELAGKIGIDGAGLEATVKTWNGYAAKQEDPDFGRTSFWMPISQGPFYALKTTFQSSVCHGGITKNEKAEVTRFDGSSIPGLYAAGEVTVSANSNGYTISAAITFARIAAQNMLAYIQAK